MSKKKKQIVPLRRCWRLRILINRWDGDEGTFLWSNEEGFESGEYKRKKGTRFEEFSTLIAEALVIASGYHKQHKSTSKSMSIQHFERRKNSLDVFCTEFSRITGNHHKLQIAFLT